MYMAAPFTRTPEFEPLYLKVTIICRYFFQRFWLKKLLANTNFCY